MATRLCPDGMHRVDQARRVPTRRTLEAGSSPAPIGRSSLSLGPGSRPQPVLGALARGAHADGASARLVSSERRARAQPRPHPAAAPRTPQQRPPPRPPNRGARSVWADGTVSTRARFAAGKRDDPSTGALEGVAVARLVDEFPNTVRGLSSRRTRAAAHASLRASFEPGARAETKAGRSNRREPELTAEV